MCFLGFYSDRQALVIFQCDSFGIAGLLDSNGPVKSKERIVLDRYILAVFQFDGQSRRAGVMSMPAFSEMDGR